MSQAPTDKNLLFRSAGPPGGPADRGAVRGGLHRLGGPEGRGPGRPARRARLAHGGGTRRGRTPAGAAAPANTTATYMPSLLAAAGPEARLALLRLPDPELRRSLAGATPAIGGAGEDGQATGVYQPRTPLPNAPWIGCTPAAASGRGPGWPGTASWPVRSLAAQGAGWPAMPPPTPPCAPRFPPKRRRSPASLNTPASRSGVRTRPRRPEDGQPFYVMRLSSRATTLHDAVAAYHHRAGAAPRCSPLELRELLNALVAVCQAAALHPLSRRRPARDLKGHGTSKSWATTARWIVLDWGLAKVLDRPEGAAPGAWSPTRGRSIPPLCKAR